MKPFIQHIKLYSIIISFIFFSEYVKATTFLVNNTTDAAIGSLRAAMLSANAIPGKDTIIFNIPGPSTIYPQSQLPILTDTFGVFIDGLTQPGASTGANPPSTATLMIEVNGIAAGGSHGFWIMSSHNTIQGLVVDSFEQDGIRMEGTLNGTYDNYIYCNFVGTDITGNIIKGNGCNQSSYWAGVSMIVMPGPPAFVYDNKVEDNLISGNYAEGVGISSCPPGDVYSNVVLANYIGTDITGVLNLGNIHDGVYIGEGAHDNLVDSNLISGNGFEGVCIVGYDSLSIYTNANDITNNIIGLTISLNALPNIRDGVSIGVYGNLYWGGYACSNVIASNTIAYNGRNGVMVWEHGNNNFNADSNKISKNSIYDNTLLGIDLDDDGVTANDTGDPDARANQEVNFPVISSALYSGVQTTVSGIIDINTTYTAATVEVFKAKTDPSGYGEGINFLGAATPDAVGNWSVIVTGVAGGDTVTATTTDIDSNTSEFCQNVTVVLVVGMNEDPDDYSKLKIFPNPFYSSTDISFKLPETIKVNITVHDIRGCIIRTIANRIFPASCNTLTWNGKDDEGIAVAPGLYYIYLKTENTSAIQKLILLR